MLEMSVDWRSAALMAYSPDAILSGQTEALDALVVRSTRLEVAQRILAIHDERSIDDFYGLSDTKDAARAELVYRLFVARPVMVTLWRGHDALARLQEIKGNTHPAAAEPGTVRSRFWCDNPICNLIHVSDSVADTEAEFAILSERRHSRRRGVFNRRRGGVSVGRARLLGRGRRTDTRRLVGRLSLGAGAH